MLGVVICEQSLWIFYIIASYWDQQANHINLLIVDTVKSWKLLSWWSLKNYANEKKLGIFRKGPKIVQVTAHKTENDRDLYLTIRQEMT